MTASRISRNALFALLTFMVLPANAQTQEPAPVASQAPDGRDASFLPPGQPVPLVAQPGPVPTSSLPNPSANAPPLALPSASPAPTADTFEAKPPPVESSTLQNIDPDAIGLLAAENGGLGAAMWKGTPRELVDRVLPALPLPTSSAALNALAQRFLLTTATVPQGAATGTSLTAQRIERLVALGDAAGAWNLALLAKPDQIDDATLRLAAEAALISSESKNVCSKLPGIIQSHNSPEWQKLLVVCQLRGGDIKAAQLGLEVLHTQNMNDDLFFELAEHNIIGGAKSLPRQMTPLKPLDMALLRLIDEPLAPEIYAHPDAVVVSELLQTKSREDNLRLALAERAAARGLIDASQLAGAYASVALTPDQSANGINGSEKNPRARALLYQAALAEKTPEKRFDLVTKFMQSLDATPLNGVTARVLADIIGNTEVAGAYIASAPATARILIMASKPKEALGWLKLIREASVSLPATAAQWQDLWPLTVLSGLETDNGYGQTFRIWLAATLKDADRAKRERIGGILLLFDAAGFAVPEYAWGQVVDLQARDKRTVSPSVLLLERLRTASAANRRGETVLLALAVAGTNANEVPLVPAIDIIRALRLVGLTADALALAREMASSLSLPAEAAAKP